MKYILLYKGSATPLDASHAGWPEWFDKVGGALADAGSPMMDGRSVHSDGSALSSATSLNGYSIIEADDMDGALKLLRDHPYLSAGDEYTIEVFEIPKK